MIINIKETIIVCVCLCVNDWSSSLDNNLPTDVVYLDFARAFDIVPYKRLLYKLEDSGIHNQLLSWLFSYLGDRKFCLRVGSFFSSFRDVYNGVSQRPLLGPLLFLVYVAVIPDYVVSQCCFADDTKLYDNLLLNYAQL